MRCEDLVICLYPYYDGDPSTYRAEMGNNDPTPPQPRESINSDRNEKATETIVTFDFAQLDACIKDIPRYSKILTECLFKSNSPFTKTFIKILKKIRREHCQLHLRLFIASSAVELHELLWETLLNPEKPDSNEPLALNSIIMFSRYLDRPDWRCIHIPPVPKYEGEKMKVLTFSVMPSSSSLMNSEDVKGTIDECDNEIGFRSFVLNSNDSGKITMETIMNESSNGYEVLVLECQGKMEDNLPFILLQNDSGQLEWLNGNNFISHLKKVNPGPRLIVLIIRPFEENWQWVANKLATDLTASGIPAVITMQGDISDDTLKRFMIHLLEEIVKSGQVNQAMAIARAAILEQEDWWMPALFIRLQSARIWYLPGFDDQPQMHWNELIASIDGEQCLPILGPGISEFVIKTQKDIANGLAKKHNYPLLCHSRDCLPDVVQYLTNSLTPPLFLQNYIDFLFSTIKTSTPVPIPTVPLAEKVRKLDDFICEQGVTLLKKDKYNPIRILSELPFPYYITTNSNNLLAHALIEAKKSPLVQLCWWHDSDLNAQLKYEEVEMKINQLLLEKQDRIIKEINDNIGMLGKSSQKVIKLREELEKWKSQIPQRLRDWLDTGFINNKNIFETPQPKYHHWFFHNRNDRTPLIFHLYGHLLYPQALALAEDQFIQFFTNVIKNGSLIHPTINTQMVTKTLLFVGFQWESWHFRVLLQYINNLEGRNMNTTLPHFAIQIDPEQTRYLKPELVRSYFKEYLKKFSYSIYWGTVEDFFRDLRNRVPSLSK